MLGEYLGAGSSVTKGLFHLNGSTTDSSGNGLSATASNITWVDGKLGQCASFNGSSGYITLPSNVASSYMTLSAWVKPAASMTQYSSIVQSMCGNTSDFGGARLLSLTAGKICMNILPTSSTQQSSPEYTLVIGEWQLITGTYDGANISLYVNGTLYGQTAYSGTIRVPSVHYSYIGNGKSWSGSINYFFNGLIDEAIIENIAWTNKQVQKYYTYVKGRFGII